MNILVVGGTGFFGIPMVEKLITDGHNVTIATRGFSKNPFTGSTKEIVMDRTNYDSVRRALSGKYYDVIIDKVAYCSNDVKNLLANASCDRYILISSCSVYAEDKENINESEFDPCQHHLIWMDRNEDFVEGKRQAERAALAYMDLSKCVFIRYPVVMGENDHTGRLKFYTDHVLQSKSMYVDDLDCKMGFINELDAGCFIAHLMNTDISGAINGSSRGTVCIRDIIEYIENKTNRKAILDDIGDFAPYNGARGNISYDLTKANETGYQFANINDWIFELINSICLE